MTEVGPAPVDQLGPARETNATNLGCVTNNQLDRGGRRLQQLDRLLVVFTFHAHLCVCAL